MDGWLKDDIKELFFRPCLSLSGNVGRKLENRLRMGQEIDERALTELFVDSLDTSSTENVWGGTIQLLRDLGIYLDAQIRKSTREHKTGADIGFIINRQIFEKTRSSKAIYATLIQCKKVTRDGYVDDFYHKVGDSRAKQSGLLLDITPSSFYFIFVPPSLVETYSTIEPIAFSKGAPGCSSPIWNIGSFGFDTPTIPFLSSQQKAETVGIIVVPALAVESNDDRGRRAKLDDILANSIPLWYWFGELLIPGFIGDRRKEVIDIASNTVGPDQINHNLPAVDFSVRIGFGSG
jgi:hypothetical protein